MLPYASLPPTILSCPTTTRPVLHMSLPPATPCSERKLIPFLAAWQVTYFGGQCSLDLGCRWELAEYEHHLAEERLRLATKLEADKERAKVRAP